MAGNELAYSQGVWHKSVKRKLDKLRSEGILDIQSLTKSALFDLQTLPYEEKIMVLKNIHNKPIEKGMSAWIIKECEEMRQKFATVKELEHYNKAKLDFTANLAVNCAEKCVKPVASKHKSQKTSRGAACKRKPQPSGGAGSEGKTQQPFKGTLHDIVLAVDILRARRDVAFKAKTQKAAGGASSKAKTQKAAGGAASQAKPQPSGGAASKGPEGFHYVRTPDGQLKKVFEPTTEENP
jgi:hypothetical protein